ncbi:MAG: hypothetical protein ACYC6R_04720 [Anaerolineales bacterium]
MSTKYDDELFKMLETSIPTAGRILLQEYVGTGANIELSQLVIKALQKLPSNKRIKYPKHRTVLSAISWLVREIPDTELQKQEILKLFADKMEIANG